MVEQKQVEDLPDAVGPMKEEPVEVFLEEFVNNSNLPFDREVVNAFVDVPQHFSGWKAMINLLQWYTNAFEVEVEVKIRRKYLPSFLQRVEPFS